MSAHATEPMTRTCGQCADEGHAAIVGADNDLVVCPVSSERLFFRGQECGYSVADLQLEHERAARRVETLDRLIRAARGSNMQAHASARDAFPELRGILERQKASTDLAMLLTEARDALATLALAAVQVGVPVDELGFNGIGVRINEALAVAGGGAR
jgi:hypothetical protein